MGSDILIHIILLSLQIVQYPLIVKRIIVLRKMTYEIRDGIVLQYMGRKEEPS